MTRPGIEAVAPFLKILALMFAAGFVAGIPVGMAVEYGWLCP